MDRDDQIDQLEAQVAALSAEVRALRAERVAQDEPATASRRGLLKLAGGAAAGAAAALVARPLGAAAAATPFQLSLINTTDSTDSNPTVIDYASTTAPAASGATANIVLVRDRAASGTTPNTSSQFASSLAGYAFQVVHNGVYGFTQNAGYGVIGYGFDAASTGVLAVGNRANVELRPNGDPPLKRSDAHKVGELVVDANADLWYCVAAGSPGTWRKVAGTAAAGSFHAITPARVYDSRSALPSLGQISNGQNRTLSVKDQRDATTGAVTSADIVPAGATAIACNLTVVNTIAGGFLTVNPGGVSTAGLAASINWSASGQILNNGIVAKISTDLKVTVVCGGTALTKTDFVLDVTGYFL